MKGAIKNFKYMIGEVIKEIFIYCFDNGNGGTDSEG